MAKIFHYTRARFDELKQKLEDLQTIKKAEIDERIKIAKSYGDLSENAEYSSAKEAEAINNSEIEELKYIIDNAEIIDESNLSKEEIHIGSTVTVEYLTRDRKYTGKVFTLEISSSVTNDTSTNVSNIIVSESSPVAKALVGHKINDIVEVETPRGICKYRVDTIV